MAQKRMFNMKIVDSDAFLDMPLSTQCLYFHLNMRADDDGFVGNPRRIVRLISANDDDLKLLLTKKFILAFESGVIVIKHWRIHNTISSNAYNETSYLGEKAMLLLKDNKSYSLNDGLPIDDSALIARRNEQAEIAKCKKNAKKMLPDKIREDKSSEDKEEISEERNTLTGIKKESEEDASLPRFRRPTLEEVTDYCEERNNGVDPQRFISYYESVGWKVGKTPMKDWKAAVRTWEAKEKKKSGKVYDHGDIAYKAARALAREVSKRLGVEFREAVLQEWAAEIEACSKEYGNSIEDMAGVMEFSQTDEFWSGIILDGYKFRAKYPQLVAAMQRSEGL